MNPSPRIKYLWGYLLALSGLITNVFSETPPALSWRQLPPLPDPCGFASPFVGVSQDTLLVGGGANFPERQLWEGGTKVWQDEVYALEKDNRTWTLAGKLPLPLAYGLSISLPEGVICAGGSDANGHHDETFLLKFSEGQLVRRVLPPLPKSIAMGAGALVGHMIYLAGGLESPETSESLGTFFAFDTNHPEAGWRSLPSWPGPGCSQGVAATDDKYFYLFSGVTFVPKSDGSAERKLLTTAYRYAPESGWEKLPDLPHPVQAAASPAPVSQGFIFLIGGVDGTQIGNPPKEFSQVPQQILAYSISEKKWRKAGNAPVGRVCVSTARWGDAWILPSGERSAGVRSPEVWSLSISTDNVP